MPGQLGIITHDTVIAHDAIMCNMTVGHDEAVVAYLGCPPVFAAPVYRNKFTYGGIIAYFHGGTFTLVFQILRNGCDYSAWKNAAVLSNPGTFHDGNIASDPGAITNFHILMNNTKGVDLNISGELCVGVYVGMWVNHNKCENMKMCKWRNF